MYETSPEAGILHHLQAQYVVLQRSWLSCYGRHMARGTEGMESSICMDSGGEEMGKSMTEQEKFEAWVKNPHMLDKSTSPDDFGEYPHPWTIGAWKGWQAAIASREPMTDQELEDSLPTNDSMSRKDALRWMARWTERFHGIGE